FCNLLRVDFGRDRIGFAQRCVVTVLSAQTHGDVAIGQIPSRTIKLINGYVRAEISLVFTSFPRQLALNNPAFPGAAPIGFASSRRHLLKSLWSLSRSAPPYLDNLHEIERPDFLCAPTPHA